MTELENAKTEAQIAELNYLKLREEIKNKLLESGFAFLESAIAKQKEELDKILQQVQVKSENIAKERTSLEEEKQKIITAYKNVKDTELMVQARLEETMKLEQARKKIDYHREHIEPCRKALDNAAKAIYNWSDALTNANIDCTALYDYLCKTLETIDEYIERERLSKVTE